jgi:hypothetical protein
VPGPGTPNLFKEDLGRNLNRVFPPQRGGFEVPTILGPTVSLVHDFPGTAPYLGYSIDDFVGANGIAQIISAISPPDGYIWIVDELSFLCNDPISREMKATIRYVTPFGTFPVTIFRQVTGTAGLAYPLGRRMIIPPKAELELSVNAIAAGNSLRWTMMYLQVPAGQFVPKS